MNKTKGLIVIICLALFAGGFLSSKNKQKPIPVVTTYPPVPIVSMTKPALPASTIDNSFISGEWTQEELSNVARSQLAYMTDVQDINNGWLLSFDYVEPNPNFKPGSSGPFVFNESNKIRKFTLSFDSNPVQKGMLVCGGHKKIKDWKEIRLDIPYLYAITVEDNAVTQIYELCVP
jgi:hypothetical protein